MTTTPRPLSLNLEEGSEVDHAMLYNRGRRTPWQVICFGLAW